MNPFPTILWQDFFFSLFPKCSQIAKKAPYFVDFLFPWQSQASFLICVKRQGSAEVSGEALAPLESCT